VTIDGHDEAATGSDHEALETGDFPLRISHTGRRSDRSAELPSLSHARAAPGGALGVSWLPFQRSGITITAARGLGYERRSAARLSMLMSIPITLATGMLIALDLRDSVLGAGLLVPVAIAAFLAFAAAYAALNLMMRFLDRVSFTPYVIYRLILGAVLLAIAYL
jgi:undecaprenyl pyrophosphate phosphatase UppP